MSLIYWKQIKKKPLDLFNGQWIENSIHLDFGSGLQPRNPFNCKRLLTVDLFGAENDLNRFVINHGDALPFQDAKFDSISGFDVLEHLSREPNNRVNDFIFYMNELNRVLKPGAIAVFVFPSFENLDAFSDPTHINFITKETINYFLNVNPKEPYSGITTTYSLVINKKLRSYKHWVGTQSIFERKLSFRRRLSLLKREIMRYIKPSHHLWILKKN